MAGTGKRASRTRQRHRKTNDRVLQARIPEQLDEELRGRAEQLGLSVSTVVRNVLLNTFDLVEGVVSDSAKIARAIEGRANLPEAAPPPLQPPGAGGDGVVIGWQEAVLNRNGVCDNCNAILARGERAAIGIPPQPRPVLLCMSCLAELSPVDDPGQDAEQPVADPTPRSKQQGVKSHK